jgi:hypothetical protein
MFEFMGKSRLFKTAIAAGVAMLGLSMPAAAAEQWATNKLKFVYPLANGSFVLAFQVDPTNCPSVGSPKYFYVAAGENGVTADGVKAMLAASFAAMAMDKDLQLAFSDSSTYCYVNRLLVVN